MTVLDISTFILAFFTFLTLLAAMWRFMVSRQDKYISELRDEIGKLRAELASQRERDRETVNRAHKRIDDLPTTFIRRDEITSHMARFETALSDMRKEQNERFDKLYAILVGRQEK